VCLAIPMRVKEKTGSVAQVEQRGLIQNVNIELVPDVNIGDYVLVHAGFAIQTIDAEWARESLMLWEKLN